MNTNTGSLSSLTEGTLNALIRDYMLIVALLVIVLLFGLYIYFIQAPMSEYFTGAPTNGTPNRVAHK